MTDPVQAVELVKGEGGRVRSSDDMRMMIEVVYRCGGQRPDEALKIIETMKEDGPLNCKVEALGWLAVAVARRAPEQAFALIDRALALLIDRSGSSGELDTVAAMVALCARRVGYPDMESVLARVLATRAVMESVQGQVFTSRSLASRSSTVALISLLDPAVAREMLLQAKASAGSLSMPQPPESGGLSLSRVRRRPHLELIARVIADFAQAQKAIDDALAEVDHTKGVSPQTHALTELAKVLAASPVHREEILWGERYNTWYPGRMPHGE